MDVRTGSKSWGYSKRPRNWKKIMYREIEEVEDVSEEVEEIEEVEEVEEVEEAPEKPPKITARIEKPKITARVLKPVPRPLVDPALLDSSFSHI